MRATTLNSYLYQQYADDDDLQALVAAQNLATQFFVDWFNDIGLPYYPALTGTLLDWVVQGLYGLQRTQLASALTPALGPLNSLVPLNSLLPLNTYVPATQTFYNLTDDVFQRILTWNFFKGDGRRFSMRWLKRRVIRFLLGVNGIDPQPTQEGFTIGAETTSAVGVVIASGACTVSIDQSLFSLQAPSVTPGILKLFKLAFEGGNLELPIRYTYAVSIIVNFVALARPNVLSSNTSAFTQTVGPTTVSVLGGTGLYLYAWTFQLPGLQGGAQVTASGSGALTTADRLAGGASVQTAVTGALAGTVGGTAQIVSAASGALSTGASLAGNALATSGATASFAGGAQIVADSPNSPSTTFTATGLTWGQTLVTVAQCTVTDTVSGLTAAATCEVFITCQGPAQILTEGGVPILTEGGVPIVVEP